MSVSAATEELKIDWSIQEDPQRLADFEARVAAGELSRLTTGCRTTIASAC